jgi:FkbM family methyltransferase
LLGALATRYARSTTHADIEVRHIEGLWVLRVGDHWFPSNPDFRYFGDSFVKGLGQAVDEVASATDYWFLYYKPAVGDVIIDVGAGGGEDALAFSRAVGDTGRVFEIEAHTSTFKRLELFCRLNQLANTTPLQLAIMDSSGSVSMVETGNWEGNTAEWTSGPSRDSVPAVTLDELCRLQGISDIAFLKMNIEGAEQLAIRSMDASIKRIKSLCIACHDFRADRGDGEQFRTRTIIEQFLQDNGFALETRPHDRRPFVRDHVYGFKRTTSG